MTTTTLTGRDWRYQLKKGYLHLYELDENDEVVAPTLDVTNGLKIEYLTGKLVFVTPAGASDDTLPDEDSIINAPDSYTEALLAYVRHKFAQDDGDTKTADYWLMKFRGLVSDARRGLRGKIYTAVTRKPFAIR